MATNSGLATPPLTGEPGLSGPYSVFPVTNDDARVRGELERLLAAARDIRPTLRERQARTEEDGQYGPDVHEYFLEHDFYKVLLPRRFGGLELGVPAFFALIAEVGRGCPSTAWCLSLSVAHTLTLSSYWPLEAQDEVFGKLGYMIAPASGNPTVATAVPVEGGFRVSGKWRYCSGAPYSTHFFPTVMIPATDDEPEYRAWIVVDREDYTVLDDWGRVIGMRGSGSNGIEMTDVFVPANRVVAETWTSEVAEPTVGYCIHGNPLYSGVFFGFAEGEVAAAAVGLGYAAVDEYERIIRTTRAPFDPNGGLRADSDDWRRVLGMAMAKVDAAAGALFDGGRKYEEFARRLVTAGETFDAGRAMRLNNQYFVVEELVWEALQELIRTAGTGFSADGQAMQRYFRDIWTTVSRTDQFQFFAAPAMAFHFAGEAGYDQAVEADGVAETDDATDDRAPLTGGAAA
ncbi:acyl-CoA dehydrogenase family protein [Agromyces bracchium]|uniref:Acyl-CoA dehydrogenase n=1 Tax=Agromyces bracchium TaxID=88376 RepID=A0A6I3MBR8_9MICO|nr:acyl-CoA dehydrogenase family protein [Agromyces bracchium]MTH69437.1 acyl-CoA dehydrogenase [Agromyces bracchium]